MEENPIFKDRRVGDPYVDRRSGENRRQVSVKRIKPTSDTYDIDKSSAPPKIL